MKLSNPFTAAADLLPGYRPNSAVLHDSDDGRAGWAEKAFRTALGGPIPDDLLATDDGTPLLRWPDSDVPAVSLMGALVAQPKHCAKSCTRCAGPLRGVRMFRLWVPGGQSAVEFQLCWFCHDVLNDVYRNGDERLLVWR